MLMTNICFTQPRSLSIFYSSTIICNCAHYRSKQYKKTCRHNNKKRHKTSHRSRSIKYIRDFLSATGWTAAAVNFNITVKLKSFITGRLTADIINITPPMPIAFFITLPAGKYRKRNRFC